MVNVNTIILKLVIGVQDEMRYSAMYSMQNALCVLHIKKPMSRKVTVLNQGKQVVV